MKKVFLLITICAILTAGCACSNGTNDALHTADTAITQEKDTAQADTGASDSEIYTNTATDKTADRETAAPSEDTSEEETYIEEDSSGEISNDEPSEDTYADVEETQQESESLPVIKETDVQTADIHKHSYLSTVVSPTCTSEGYTEHTCSSCGNSYTDSIKKATGHKYTSVVTKPTCTKDGSTKHTCSSCGNSYTDSIKKATGHKYTSVVTKPTCTKDGSTKHTCSSCGNSYTDSVKKATGHKYVTSNHAVTCTSDGYTKHTCSACGDTYKDNIKKAPGHSWSEWDFIRTSSHTSTGLKKRICNTCGLNESKDIPKVQPSDSELCDEILRLVNIEREKEGLAPLAYYHNGQTAADIRALEISESFSHTRLDGSRCFTVFDEDLWYYYAGENIASGYPTPQAVVNGWMNSSGHRANILNTNFTHIIVGTYSTDGNYGMYWVQLFIGI